MARSASGIERAGSAAKSFPVADTGQEGVHDDEPVHVGRELRGVRIRHHEADIVSDDSRPVGSERLASV